MRRDKRLLVSLSAVEHGELKRQAGEAGVSMAELVRRRVFSVSKDPPMLIAKVKHITAAEALLEYPAEAPKPAKVPEKKKKPGEYVLSDQMKRRQAARKAFKEGRAWPRMGETVEEAVDRVAGGENDGSRDPEGEAAVGGPVDGRETEHAEGTQEGVEVQGRVGVPEDGGPVEDRTPEGVDRGETHVRRTDKPDHPVPDKLTFAREAMKKAEREQGVDEWT